MVAGYLNSGPTSLPQSAIIVAAVLILTGLGTGSVLGWAVSMMSRTLRPSARWRSGPCPWSY
jgi:hypothetical protein